MSSDSYDIVSFYLSNFTHFDFWHLANNLSLYLFLAVPTYVMYRYLDAVSEFRIALTLSIYFSASLSSWTFLIFAGPGMRSYGFSGVAPSLFGLTFYSMARLLASNRSTESIILYLILVMLGPITRLDVGVALIGEAIYVLVSVAVVFYVYYLARIFLVYRLYRNKYLVSMSESIKILLLTAIAYILVIYVRFYMVDVKITRIGSGIIVNNVAHLAGMITGYITPIISHILIHLKYRIH